MSVVVLQQQARGRTASGLDAALARVLDRARSRIGDPYLWDGEDPGGFDCSGFLKWAYEGRVRSFTDWIFDHTVATSSPRPGDVVLYEYVDPLQDGVRFPHVGLWLSDTLTLDARSPEGVGIHPHVTRGTVVTRRVPGLDGTTSLFTPEQIASVLGAPVANIRSQWPLVVAALTEFGIADEAVQIAAIATVGVESSTFMPVREAWWLDRDFGYAWAEQWRRENLWYYGDWGYYGRGLIQLTHEGNYAAAEHALGIFGLVENPDLALEQHHSARILAWYFANHGGSPLIPQAARAGDWREVRRLVQGEDAGLAAFLTYVAGLQAVRRGG